MPSIRNMARSTGLEPQTPLDLPVGVPAASQQGQRWN